MSQPTVFYQPGSTASGLQTASISSLIESRSIDESHIVATAFAVNNLISARITDEANIATLTNSSTNQLIAINSLIASRTADEANIATLTNSSTSQLATINGLIASRTIDETNIATLQTAITTLQSSQIQDVTYNKFWFNAFGGASTNFDGSIIQSQGTLAGTIRVYKSNSQVTITLYSCIGNVSQHGQTAIYSQQIPEWARPSMTTVCALNVYSDRSSSGEMCIQPNGTISMYTLNNSWGTNGGISQATCITYLI